MSKGKMSPWFSWTANQEDAAEARGFWRGVCAERAACHARLAYNQSWGGWQAREESAIHTAIAAGLRRWASE